MELAYEHWLREAAKEKERGLPFAIVTVVGTKGSSPRGLGSKMLVNSQGRRAGTIGGGRLEELVILDAQAILTTATGPQQVQKFQYPLSEKAGQCCGGVVEILVEPINTGPHLFIFGVGHVGTALANTLAGTAFTLHAVDERAEWCHSTRLPEAICRHLQNPLEFVLSWDWDRARSWAVVLTHSHDLDRALMEQLVPLDLVFLGLIGSKTKWRRLHERLKTAGIALDRLAKVHCPVGLDLGGEAPQEIAISIGAQVLQSYYQATQHRGVANSSIDLPVWTSAQDDPCENTGLK